MCHCHCHCLTLALWKSEIALHDIARNVHGTPSKERLRKRGWRPAVNGRCQYCSRATWTTRVNSDTARQASETAACVMVNATALSCPPLLSAMFPPSPLRLYKKACILISTTNRDAETFSWWSNIFFVNGRSIGLQINKSSGQHFTE